MVSSGGDHTEESSSEPSRKGTMGLHMVSTSRATFLTLFNLINSR